MIIHCITITGSHGPNNLSLSTGLDEFDGICSYFNGPDADITDNSPGEVPQFKTVNVKSGRWILYSRKRYNDDDPSSKGKIQIVDQGTEILDFQPKSLRPIPVAQQSLMLFESKNFEGTMVRTVTDRPTLEEFPEFNRAGVSSIIIGPLQRWRFFLGSNFTGNSFVLSPGKYKNPSMFYGQDDKIQSVKKV